MDKELVLAIDQGTTGTTVLAVDTDLDVVARKTQEFRQIYPQPGWVEHNLEDIWKSTVDTIQVALSEAAIDAARIRAIGITNQRETVGLWERASGTPLSHAIVWQCRRTEDRCKALREAGHEERVRTQTGLVLDPYFSGTKIAWLLDHVPQARSRADRGELAAGTIDTFLVWRLTGGAAHVTDVSNASRTMLMDLETLEFEDGLLDLVGVPRSVLPRIASSAEVYGHTRGVPGLPDGIPIAGMAGDQQAALVGQACFSEGEGKCTYGTGAFILVNTKEQIRRSSHGLLTTVAWRLGADAPAEYALEGSVFVAGAAVQWLRDGLGLIEQAKDVEALAREVDSSGDVVFVPALTGLGAPHWAADARGLICGITRDTTKAHLARATLEGIALSCADVMGAMKKDAAFAALRVDGGAAANDLLMQMQADLLGVEVTRPTMLETTAAGAAFLAGLGVGLFASTDEIRAVWKKDQTFYPREKENTERLREKWERALERTLRG